MQQISSEPSPLTFLSSPPLLLLLISAPCGVTTTPPHYRCLPLSLSPRNPSLSLLLFSRGDGCCWGEGNGIIPLLSQGCEAPPPSPLPGLNPPPPLVLLPTTTNSASVLWWRPSYTSTRSDSCGYTREEDCSVYSVYTLEPVFCL